jgi:hypothetical protein
VNVGPLRNVRHERFAQARAKGASLGDAYLAAGYTTKSARQAGNHGGRLARRALVAARIEELQERIAERTIASAAYDRDYVIRALRENLERALEARPVLDRQGNPTGEYRYDGSVVNRAAELLGVELGMFVRRHATLYGRIEQLESLSDEELRREANAARARLDDALSIFRPEPARPVAADTGEPPEKVH